MCSCIQTGKVLQGGGFTAGIHVTDAAIGLRRASTNKEMWTKSLCFSVVELEKKVMLYQVEVFPKMLERASFAHRW